MRWSVFLFYPGVEETSCRTVPCLPSFLSLLSIPFPFFSSPAVLRRPGWAGRGQAESFSPGGLSRCCRFWQEQEQEQKEKEPDLEWVPEPGGAVGKRMQAGREGHGRGTDRARTGQAGNPSQRSRTPRKGGHTGSAPPGPRQAGRGPDRQGIAPARTGQGQGTGSCCLSPRQCVPHPEVAGAGRGHSRGPRGGSPRSPAPPSPSAGG
ncbi:hypothetical protein Nmel_013993 [Mimus melanotis]